MNRLLQHTRILIPLCVLVIAAACSSATPTPTEERPTVTPIPVFQYVVPTEVPQMATVAAQTVTQEAVSSALDPEKVQRGRDRYVVLECNTCHGENGEGSDKGSALTNFAMSEDDFISFMRSGGSMGKDHQYSTNRLSTTGGSNLYEYLLSLSRS